MVRKIKKGKKKKTTTTTRGGVKVVTNIHVNSKSGTRSARQRRGGVGGSVAPSGVSTISHVPLVMNVPAPDATQRETQYLHAIKNVQDDIIALKQASVQLALQQQPPPPNPKDQLMFQQLPSKANYEVSKDDKAEAKRAHSTPPSRGRSITPKPPSLSPAKEQPHSAQGIGLKEGTDLKGSHISGQSKLVVPTAEHEPILLVGKEKPQTPTPKKRGRKSKVEKAEVEAARAVETGKQRTLKDFM